MRPRRAQSEKLDWVVEDWEHAHKQASHTFRSYDVAIVAAAAHIIAFDESADAAGNASRFLCGYQSVVDAGGYLLTLDVLLAAVGQYAAHTYSADIGHVVFGIVAADRSFIDAVVYLDEVGVANYAGSPVGLDVYGGLVDTGFDSGYARGAGGNRSCNSAYDGCIGV